MKPIPPATERRIRRAARSEARRELAWELRSLGWSYIAIGKVLGIGRTRSQQLVRKAELIRKKGAPSQGRPPHSDDPLAAGRTVLHMTRGTADG
jgi:hypothetical protein